MPIPKQNLYQTLALDLTLTDDNFGCFWNEHSMAYNSMLWLPHKTVSVESDSLSSSDSSNWVVEESSFWKRKMIPVNSTQVNLSVSSPASLIPITEKGQQGDEKHSPSYEEVSKKIRIFPENEELYIQALHVSRRAYNLSVEGFRKGLNPKNLREDVIRLMRVEGSEAFDTNLIGEAYRKANTSRISVIRKRVKKEKAELHFKSWLYSPKSFNVKKLGIKGSIYPKSLGKVQYSEYIPPEAIGKSAIVTYDNGQWFISVKKYCEIKAPVKENKVVALDPGVRTFMTSFSRIESVEYGENFSRERLLPLALKVRKLVSERDSLNNIIKKADGEVLQWQHDKLVNLKKRIDMTRAKHKNLKEDLHRKVAYDIVMNNDIILLPTFETRSMVKKSIKALKRRRNIGKETVVNMLALGHYQFKMMVKWMAKKYGKIVIDVNEAFTSKTRPDGVIDHKLGGNKEIKVDDKIINRDINGARNILIKYLAHQYEHSILA